MDHALERYLNDHLAGSSGALELLDALADRQENETERAFFVDLRKRIQSDQEILKKLLETGGMNRSRMMQAIGGISEKAGRLKLLWEGLNPGELGLFEALEFLELGIHGKSLLWAMLSEISHHHPEWADINFPALGFEAILQRDAVEERRLHHGRTAFGRKKVC